jgi:hypothetical protein
VLGSGVSLAGTAAAIVRAVKVMSRTRMVISSRRFRRQASV